MSAPPPAHLLGVGTATPSHSLGQEAGFRFLARTLEAHLPGSESESLLPWARRIFARSGIENRATVLPDFLCDDPRDHVFFPPNAALEPFPSTARRMERFETESVPLAESAARVALERAAVTCPEVTHLVITTCTGFFAPGPDVLLAQRLGLSSGVERTVIGFMGCYAGFNGVRHAAQIVQARPDAVVLLVCLELCSLHFQRVARPDLLVANAIFGDGSSAMVWAGELRGSDGWRLRATHTQVKSDSLDQMSWRIGDHGFEMSLSREVPELLGKELEPFVATLLDRARLRRSDVRGWAVHPGGRRILEASREPLGLEEDELAPSFEVLRRHGNVSSATLGFVLEETFADPERDPLVALGFGPGLTLEGAVLARGA